MKIGLGDKVRDSLSGMTGIVQCVSYWLHGCVRISVVPDKTWRKGGEDITTTYAFDEPQLELVKRQVVKPKMLIEAPVQVAPKPKNRVTGGPPREGRGFKRI